MKKMIVLLVVGVCFGLLSFCLAGCGYTASSALPTHLKTVYVDHFKNNIDYETASRTQTTYIPLLEMNIRSAVIDRFQFDGNLSLMSDKSAADLVLTGELIEYNRFALRYNDEDDVQEYRLQLVMKLTMTDTSTGEPLWLADRFIGEQDYFTEGAQAITEETAVSQATVDLARRIVEKTVENW